MGFLDKVKDIAGKVGDSVEKGAKSVSDSAQKMTQKSNINKEIKQCETAINDAYVAIGKKFFEENPENEAYAEFINTIKEKLALIDEKKKELAKLDDNTTCPECGATISKDAKFCDKCGAKIPEPAPEEAAASETPAVEPEAKPACKNCGEVLPEGASFCEKCGTKVEADAE